MKRQPVFTIRYCKLVNDHKQLAPLYDDLVLVDSGLDSLCFAIVVARLEDALGIDPFIVRKTLTSSDPERLH
jgi:acyl carrier protein